MTHALTKAAFAAAVLAFAAGGRAADAPRVVEITAKRFAFDPAEIHLRKGEAATLRITSRDVTHGLFLRPLGIDATIAPGKVTEVAFTPGEAGRFNAICDHFCGSGHGNMHLTIVVEDAPKEASR
ncbi:MAG: cupredoxin domain-containing protein [Anaeromyxobacteraceae bacterium]